MKLSAEDPSTWGPLFEVADQYGVDPFVPTESGAFFTALFRSYDGPEDDAAVSTWLHDELSRAFACFDKKPDWIQGAEWPFHNGRPMLFVGQLDVPGRDSNAASPYHDDTSLFVFTAPGTDPVVITQQY